MAANTQYVQYAVGLFLGYFAFVIMVENLQVRVSSFDESVGITGLVSAIFVLVLNFFSFPLSPLQSFLVWKLEQLCYKVF